MSSTGKFIAGLAAGVLAGVALGILFAPDKGSETRRKLKEKGKGLADDLKEAFEQGMEKLSDLKDDLEQSIKDKTEKFT